MHSVLQPGSETNLKDIEKLALVASVYDEWNEGNMEYVFQLLAPSDELTADEAGSLAAFRRMLLLLKSALPDLVISRTGSEVRGEAVVEHILAVGSHCGEVRGVEPTDAPVNLTGTNTWEWRGARLVGINAPELGELVETILGRGGER